MDERVGFGRRLGALCLDVVLTVVIGMVLGSMLGGILGGAAGAGATAGTADGSGDLMATGGVFGMIFGAFLGIAVAGVLYGLIEAFTGASPGKMLLGIRIRAADGSDPGLGTLLARYAIKNSSMIFTGLVLLTGVEILRTVGSLAGLVVFLGCFMALGAAKQALHDMVLSTAVYPSK